LKKHSKKYSCSTDERNRLLNQEESIGSGFYR